MINSLFEGEYAVTLLLIHAGFGANLGFLYAIGFISKYKLDCNVFKTKLEKQTSILIHIILVVLMLFVLIVEMRFVRNYRPRDWINILVFLMTFAGVFRFVWSTWKIAKKGVG